MASGYCYDANKTLKAPKVACKPIFFLNVILGAAAEFKLSDISVETILSEEGHQVGAQ